MDSDSYRQRLSTRRSYLRGVATATLATSAGCLVPGTSMGGPETPKRVTVTIKTTPTDDDPYAIRIAQRLAGHLQAVGIGTQVTPMRTDELLDDLLIGHEFDLFVTAHPGGRDPEFLYPLLHSRFATEPGWQNPYGCRDETIDTHLEQQRDQTGIDRLQTTYKLQRAIGRTQPFTVLGVPDRITAIRDDAYDGWTGRGLSSPLDYLGLRIPPDQAATAGTPAADRERTLRVAYNELWITRNLNPLAVEYRGEGTVTGLLYDPLLRRHGSGFVPWLAASWEWQPAEGGNSSAATVTLRDGVRWHDDRPITPEDVVFTYRFLSDMSSHETTTPAPRFRGPVSLVDDVEHADERRVRFRLETSNQTVAARALTVPLLPRHEWEPRRSDEPVSGADETKGLSQVLGWRNREPVGSGPLRFQRSITDEALILERFDDHFLHREPGPDLPEPLAEGVAFDRVVFRIVPSDAVAVELIAAGEADGTGTSLNAADVPSVTRTDAVRLLVGRSTTFYHVGYNARREPGSNPRFRRAVAGLVDKESIIQDVFHGYGIPVASPLAMTEWLAPDLEWTDRDPVRPFLGSRGQLDVSRARQAFEQAGYRHNENGGLVRG